MNSLLFLSLKITSHLPPLFCLRTTKSLLCLGAVFTRFKDKIIMLQTYCGYAGESREREKVSLVISVSPSCVVGKIVTYCMGNGGPQIVNTPI